MLKYIFKKNPIFLLLSAFLTLIFGFYRPVLAKLIQYDINVASRSTPPDWQKFIFINLAVLIVLIVLNWIGQYVNEKFYATSQHLLNQDVFHSLSDFKYHTWSVTNIVKLFNNDIPLIIRSYFGSLNSILYFVVSFLAGSTLIITLNVKIYLYIFFVASLSLFLSKRFSNDVAVSQKQYNDSLATNAEVIEDTFSDFITLKNLPIFSHLENRFKQTNTQSQTYLFSLGYKKAKITISTDACVWGLQLGMYIIGVFLIINKELNFAELIAITQAADTITTPIFWFSNILGDLYGTKKIREEVLTIIHSTDTQSQLDEPQVSGDSLSFELQNAFFKNAENQIGPYSLTIYPSTKYMLIGANGSGKSTLFKSLLTNQPYKGKVNINGVPIEQWSLEGLNKQITYLGQTIKLYQGTVKENIVCFDTNIKLDQYESLITKLFPYKEKTFFAKEISQLSGGEKQLVGLARSLYLDRKLLFLDEAFSALDKETVTNILDTLLSMDDVTLVLSIHHYTQDIIDRFDGVIELVSH